MGCDGGTIPKRDELVRTKKKPEQKDKTADLAFKWRNCAISQETLVQPFMACELGRLYNKESVLEFLIDKTKFECAASFEHLRGLKDVKELKLTDNPAAKKKCAEKGDGYIDMQASDFICPVANIEMNGIYRFCFLWTCGCVVSEKALREIKTQTCHKCGKAFTDNDVVMLNGTEEDVTQNQYRMDYRRMQARLAKKAKKEGKRSAAVETVSSDGATAAKQAHLDPSTSASTTSSKLTSEATRPSAKLANGDAHFSKLTNGPSHDTKLTNGASRDTKLTNGASRDSQLASSSKLGKAKSIQSDPKASEVYKSLFNTCHRARNQTQGHWVTYNPQYF